MFDRAFSTRVVPWLALLLSGVACNALFSIEEGVLVPGDGQGGGTPDPSQVIAPSNGGGGAGSPPTAGGPGTDVQRGAAAGGGSDMAPGGSANGTSPMGMSIPLPPDVMIHPAPLTFNGPTVTHAGGLVAGRLYAFDGPLGSTITPDCADDPSCFSAQTGSEVCVSGSTEIVLDGDFVSRWGAELQLQLQAPPWDRVAGRVRGFSFRITGTGLDNLNFSALTPPTAEEMYPIYGLYLPAISDVQHDVLFESMRKPIWAPATSLPDTMPLVNVHWSIASAAEGAQTFDFCVSEIRPIVAVE